MGFSLLFGVTTFSFGKTVAPRQPVASAVVAANPDSGHVVTLTAYNAVPWQTDSNPLETASGAYSNPEIIAARSADLAAELPFGTVIELDGSGVSSGDSCGYSRVAPLIGYRVIEDSMNARYTDRVDVLLGTQENYVKPDGSSMNAADVLGICKGITVRVVGYVDINHLPKTQAALAALVEKGGGLALNK